MSEMRLRRGWLRSLAKNVSKATSRRLPMDNVPHEENSIVQVAGWKRIVAVPEQDRSKKQYSIHRGLRLYCRSSDDMIFSTAQPASLVDPYSPLLHDIEYRVESTNPTFLRHLVF